MFGWLNGPGRVFKDPIPSSTNYLTAYEKDGKPKATQTRVGPDGQLVEVESSPRPFPHNPVFISESVLSEELRNEIYEQVVNKGKSVKTVSVMFGVDMRRIGAVVRLVELEKRMKAEVSLNSPNIYTLSPISIPIPMLEQYDLP